MALVRSGEFSTWRYGVIAPAVTELSVVRVRKTPCERGFYNVPGLVSAVISVENVLVPKSSDCPEQPAETAEAYALGHLTPAAALAFRKHYLGCPECAAELQTAEDFVRAMKEAARDLQRPARRTSS
jgi:hypothetical protein